MSYHNPELGDSIVPFSIFVTYLELHIWRVSGHCVHLPFNRVGKFITPTVVHVHCVYHYACIRNVANVTDNCMV